MSQKDMDKFTINLNRINTVQGKIEFEDWVDKDSVLVSCLSISIATNPTDFLETLGLLDHSNAFMTIISTSIQIPCLHLRITTPQFEPTWKMIHDPFALESKMDDKLWT